jgi:hypothetical protein
MEHRKSTIKGVTPLLLGGGIEEAFNMLFAIKRTTKAGKTYTLIGSLGLASTYSGLWS